MSNPLREQTEVLLFHNVTMDVILSSRLRAMDFAACREMVAFAAATMSYRPIWMKKPKCRR